MNYYYSLAFLLGSIFSVFFITLYHTDIFWNETFGYLGVPKSTKKIITILLLVFTMLFLSIGINLVLTKDSQDHP